MRFRVEISRAEGIADPEAKTVLGALRDLGFDEVTDVGFGRTIEVEVADGSPDPDERVHAMCERLLANPVIEDYRVTRLS